MSCSCRRISFVSDKRGLNARNVVFLLPQALVMCGFGARRFSAAWLAYARTASAAVVPMTHRPVARRPGDVKVADSLRASPFFLVHLPTLRPRAGADQAPPGRPRRPDRGPATVRRAHRYLRL